MIKIPNPFKKKRDPVKPLPPIRPQREAEFITIDRVKAALSTNDFKEIIELFELFLDRDLKIAEGVEKRQNAIVGIKPVITAGAAEKRVLDRLFEQVPLSEWLYAMSDGIYYGYSLLELEFEAMDGMVLPSGITHHAPTLLHYSDKKETHYIATKKEKKLYIPDLSPRVVMYRHAKKGDDIQNRALAYKLLYYALLKHVTIGYNIQYFDSLAVPPLIIKSADISDKEQIEALTTALMALKSNSYGIFPGDIDVDSLKAGTQADFLGLIEYFDGLIAQYLVGATSISDGRAGSLALARMQEERFQEKIAFDAKRIEEGMSDILNLILSLNLSSFTPVTFELPITKETTPEEFATIVKDLSAGGYQIEEEEIEKKLGIKIKRNPLKEKNHKEYNSKLPEKPFTLQEQLIDAEDMEPIQEELHQAYQILEQCSSYEEALIQIEQFENPKLEEALRRLIFANDLVGTME